MPDVDRLFTGGATPPDDAPEAVDADEPVVDVAAGVVGEPDGVGPVVFVALADGSGCLTVGSGPQPTINRDVTQRQTMAQPDKCMA